LGRGAGDREPRCDSLARRKAAGGKLRVVISLGRADRVVVTGPSSENGLLHIDLVREVPEAQKPGAIAINKAAWIERETRAPHQGAFFSSIGTARPERC
jgi:hypothetical protein